MTNFDSRESFSNDRMFHSDQIEWLANTASRELSVDFIGDEAEEFIDNLEVITDFESNTGIIIPTVGYSRQNGKLNLKIEPNSINDFAEKTLSDYENDAEVSVSDLTRLFVGGGVARAILAWKSLKAKEIDYSASSPYIDKICDKRYLWEAVDKFDDNNGTTLRRSVEKLGDEQIPIINIYRFVTGVSLHYLNETIDLQSRIPETFRPILLEEEQSRVNDLKFNLALFEPNTAFDLYDKSAPQLMYALSFPMEPAEEISSIFAQ